MSGFGPGMSFQMLPMSAQLDIQMQRMEVGIPRIDDRILHEKNPVTGAWVQVKTVPDTYFEQMKTAPLPLQRSKQFCDVDTAPPIRVGRGNRDEDSLDFTLRTVAERKSREKEDVQALEQIVRMLKL